MSLQAVTNQFFVDVGNVRFSATVSVPYKVRSASNKRSATA